MAAPRWRATAPVRARSLASGPHLVPLFEVALNAAVGAKTSVGSARFELLAALDARKLCASSRTIASSSACSDAERARPLTVQHARAAKTRGRAKRTREKTAMLRAQNRAATCDVG